MALTTILNKVSSISSIVAITPQDKIGIRFQGETKGFLFDIVDEETATLQSDITDHFAEDNVFLQDHIAIKPTVITVRGFIGELTDKVPEGLESLQLAKEKLYALSAFTPSLSVAALRAYNTGLQIYNVGKNAVKAAESAFGFFTGAAPEQTAQQKAFIKFKDAFEKRQLFEVQTPWALYKSMAIQSLKVTQTGESKHISDFELSFKEIRLAKNLRSFGQLKELTFNGRTINQMSALINKGLSSPKDMGALRIA